MLGESARARGAGGLDGAARTGGGEAGELVVVGRAIRSEKARVCGFEPCSFFFPLAVWEREGKGTETDGVLEVGSIR